MRVTRSECARVARHARCVRVREDLIEAYAAQLSALPSHPLPAVTPAGAGDLIPGWRGSCRPGRASRTSHRTRGADFPSYKRAQLTGYDMACAAFVPPGSEGELTMFADKLVPHVLRVDGLLAHDAGLSADIEAGPRLLLHGSPREVENRACGLHAVESIVACRPDLTAPGVDQLLWHRDQDPRHKAQPRHRARCEAY